MKFLFYYVALSEGVLKLYQGASVSGTESGIPELQEKIPELQVNKALRACIMKFYAAVKTHSVGEDVERLERSYAGQGAGWHGRFGACVFSTDMEHMHTPRPSNCIPRHVCNRNVYIHSPEHI